VETHAPTERIQYLFALKQLLDANIRDLAKTITLRCGRDPRRSRWRTAPRHRERQVACGIPTLMMGSNVEDIARGIGEIMIRQPVGVVAHHAVQLSRG
jgi:malonate-semialdehyde dehydrogenase (acetylating)/methylmalonate-semialdehyde dehydrogenase